MFHLTTPCFAAALALAGPPAADPIPVVARTLPNGMRVLLVERHDGPTIACGWVARVGSANEQVGQTGLAHLFEHMMFKGTRTIGTRDAARDAELNRLQDKVYDQIMEEMDVLREKQRRGEIADMGAPGVRSERHRRLLGEMDALVKEQRGLIVKDELDKIYKQAGATGLNANTTTDRTFFHITIPANKLELWAWMESDRLRNAMFREFYSERDVVLEERRMRIEATPTGLVNEAFGAMQTLAAPYRWPVIGWPSDITQVTRQQADAFFATYYAPSNITAILVGDFKAEEAFRLVESYFGDLPDSGRPMPRVITTEPAHPAEQRMVAEAETNPFVRASFKIVPGVHYDAYALGVLASVLSGESGRLTKALVTGKKVALQAGATSHGGKFGGEFTLFAVPSPGHALEEVEQLLYQEVEKIQRDGITEQELQKVKNHVQAGTFRTMESNDGLRDQLAEAESMGTYRDLLEEPQRFQAVTREDVKRAAGMYFAKENRSVLVVNRRKPASLNTAFERKTGLSNPLTQVQKSEIKR
jgi:predicted Zn-dependent peptidase